MRRHRSGTLGGRTGHAGRLRLHADRIGAAGGLRRVKREARGARRHRVLVGTVDEYQARCAPEAADTSAYGRRIGAFHGYVRNGHCPHRSRAIGHVAGEAGRLRRHGDRIGTAVCDGRGHREGSRAGGHAERVAAVGQHQSRNGESADRAADIEGLIRAGDHHVGDICGSRRAAAVCHRASLSRGLDRHDDVIPNRIGKHRAEGKTRCSGADGEVHAVAGQRQAAGSQAAYRA